MTWNARSQEYMQRTERPLGARHNANGWAYGAEF
jgi:hypothetical protein